MMDYGFVIMDYGFLIIDYGFLILDYGFFLIDYGFVKWITDSIMDLRFLQKINPRNWEGVQILGFSYLKFLFGQNP